MLLIKIKNYKKLVDEVKNYLRKYLELKGIEIKGKSFKCFQHNDSTPSAGLTKDERDFKCHGCGIAEDIFTSYSIIENKSIRGQDFFNVLRKLADMFNLTYNLDDENYRMVKDKEYIYKNIVGEEVYKIVKYHEENDHGNILRRSNGKISIKFKAFTKNINGGWDLGIDEKERYMYNLPDVIKCIQQEIDIYFVEG